MGPKHQVSKQFFCFTIMYSSNNDKNLNLDGGDDDSDVDGEDAEEEEGDDEGNESEDSDESGLLGEYRPNPATFNPYIQGSEDKLMYVCMFLSIDVVHLKDSWVVYLKDSWVVYLKDSWVVY